MEVGSVQRNYGSGVNSFVGGSWIFPNTPLRVADDAIPPGNRQTAVKTRFADVSSSNTAVVNPVNQ